MEQIKNALKTLEQAVLKLETAVKSSQKKTALAEEQVVDLKQVIANTYGRLDKALTRFKQEEL